MQKGASSMLELPERGCVSEEEMDAIGKAQLLLSKAQLNHIQGPMQLARKIEYPLVCQVIAGNDKIFNNSHGCESHEALEQTGVINKIFVAPGQKHAFDIWEKAGGKMDREIICPAVEGMISRAIY